MIKQSVLIFLILAVSKGFAAANPPTVNEVISDLAERPAYAQLMADALKRANKNGFDSLNDLIQVCSFSNPNQKGDESVAIHGFNLPRSIGETISSIGKSAQEISELYLPSIKDALLTQGFSPPIEMQLNVNSDYISVKIRDRKKLCMTDSEDLNAAVGSLVHMLTHYAYLNPFTVVDPLSSSTADEFTARMIRTPGSEYDAFKNQISFLRSTKNNKVYPAMVTKDLFSKEGQLESGKEENLTNVILNVFGYIKLTPNYFGVALNDVKTQRLAINRALALRTRELADMEDPIIRSAICKSVENLNEDRIKNDARLNSLSNKAAGFGLSI